MLEKLHSVLPWIACAEICCFSQLGNAGGPPFYELLHQADGCGSDLIEGMQPGCVGLLWSGGTVLFQYDSQAPSPFCARAFSFIELPVASVEFWSVNRSFQEMAP